MTSVAAAAAAVAATCGLIFLNNGESLAKATCVGKANNRGGSESRALAHRTEDKPKKENPFVFAACAPTPVTRIHMRMFLVRILRPFTASRSPRNCALAGRASRRVTKSSPRRLRPEFGRGKVKGWLASRSAAWPNSFHQKLPISHR